MRSAAVYDLMAEVLRGVEVNPRLRRRALAASPLTWKRALRLEDCAPQLDRAFRAARLADNLPLELDATLRAATSEAVRHAIRLPAQLVEIAELAHESGIRLMALKGAARLLSGEVPGARSIADIDLMSAPEDARTLHALVQSRLGYHAYHAAPEYHLPLLYRAGCLPVEIHLSLSDAASPLDEDIWRDTRSVRVGDRTIEIPSPTAHVLHTLEHAVVVHWATRYRLRDMLDVASAWTEGVDAAAVRAHLRASPHRLALETLLSASRRFGDGIPMIRPRSWRTVRRVALARHAVAAYVRSRGLADRLCILASVLAEGSPRALVRPARLALRGVRSRAAAAVSALLVACADPAGPVPPEVPAFVFVSNVDGNAELYRMRNDSIVRLTTNDAVDAEPHSARGRLVFSSNRDGNFEIYMADPDAGNPRRLTTDAGGDTDPALSPDGSRIAFVSGRSGTPRIWVVDSAGSAADTLRTGSAKFVPELAPAWSPVGDRIAFTSARTGTSQVFLVDAGGGDAVQLSHESGGAFNPAWTAAGTAVLYTTGAGTPMVRKVFLSGGAAATVVSDDRGISAASCLGALCLAVTEPYGANADLVVLAGERATPHVLLRRAADDRAPAFIIP